MNIGESVTQVLATDEPDERYGDACHTYEVRDKNGLLLQTIRLQHGPTGCARPSAETDTAG